MATSEPATAETLRALVDALGTDLGPRMPVPRVALFERSAGIWVFDSADGLALPDIEEYDTSAPWIGAIGGDTFTIEEMTLAGVVVELVSRFQDIVIDGTGHGWPELYRAGTFIGLAQPVEREDHVGWAIPGQPLLPFGALAGAKSLEVA